MFYRLLLLSSCLLFAFASCNSGAEQRADGNAVTAKDTTAIQEDIYADIDAWQGNIDGRIPVLMWYRIHDDIISGYLFYTDNKIKDSIRIIGTAGDSMARLLEMFHDGNITGIWDLEIHSSAAEGTWFSPKTRKQLGASLMHIDTAVTIHRIDSVIDISGEYSFGYSEEGSQGFMTIKRNKETVTVEFQNVTDAPARNMALLGPFNATVTDNEIIYRSTEYGDCAVRIRFFNGFAVVNYVDEQADCGFGNRATVAGIYIKTK